jgi:hypothetical protein
LSLPGAEPRFLRLLSVRMVGIPNELFRLPLRYLYKDSLIFSYLFLKERVVTSVPMSLSAVCGRLLAGIAGSNPDGAWMSVFRECCVSSGRGPFDGRSLAQRSPPECGVTECDLETSTMRRLWPTRECYATGRKRLRV